MEGTCSGRGLGRGSKHLTTEGDTRETMAELNPEPQIDPNVQ